jgi:hypothetical protein
LSLKKAGGKIMDIVFEIPENFRISFQRMKRILPTPIRYDSVVQKTTLAYLKLGGERLARHYIKLVRYRLKELDELKKMAQEEALAKERALAKEKAIAEEKEAEAAKEREAAEDSETPVNESKVEEAVTETAVDNIAAIADETPVNLCVDMNKIPFTELGGGVYLPEKTVQGDIAIVAKETPLEDIPAATDEVPVTETESVEPAEKETPSENIYAASDETPVTQLEAVEKAEERNVDTSPSEIVNWEFLIPEQFQIQDDSSEDIDTATNFTDSIS